MSRNSIFLVVLFVAVAIVAILGIQKPDMAVVPPVKKQDAAVKNPPKQAPPKDQKAKPDASVSLVAKSSPSQAASPGALPVFKLNETEKKGLPFLAPKEAKIFVEVYSADGLKPISKYKGCYYQIQEIDNPGQFELKIGRIGGKDFAWFKNSLTGEKVQDFMMAGNGILYRTGPFAVDSDLVKFDEKKAARCAELGGGAFQALAKDPTSPVSLSKILPILPLLGRDKNKGDQQWVRLNAVRKGTYIVKVGEEFRKDPKAKAEFKWLYETSVVVGAKPAPKPNAAPAANDAKPAAVPSPAASVAAKAAVVPSVAPSAAPVKAAVAAKPAVKVK